MRKRDTSKETERRLRFAAEFVKCGVGSDAARAAGVTEASAAVRASEWLRREDVQNEIQRLRASALARIEMRNRGAVADLAETLEHATAILQLDATQCYDDQGELSMAKVRELPALQRRALQIESQHTTDAEGQSFSRYKIKRDPVALGAAKLLREHYDGVGKPAPGPNVAVINLPQELQVKLGKALLAQEVVEGELVNKE